MAQRRGGTVATARRMPNRGRIDEELIELALAGAGWQAIVERLAATTGDEVRLIGVHGGCLASSPVPGAAGMTSAAVAAVARDAPPQTVTCLDGWTALASAVTAGPRGVGVLALAGPPSVLTEELFAAARHAIGIEAVRRDAQAQARSESAARLIDEVRYGVLGDPREVARMAGRFGLRLDRPHTAVAFHYEGDNQHTWQTALSWVENPIRHDHHTGWTILPDDAAERTRIRIRLQGMVGNDAQVLVAVGSTVEHPADTTRSFFDAEVTLAVLRRRGEGGELRFEDLGALGLLFSIPRERLARFVEQRLGPVIDRADLLDTLAAWYETNGSRAAVAARLHLHRNSVGHRLARVGELIGIDPLDIGTAFDVQSALAARDVLAILDELSSENRGQPVNPRTD